MTSLEHVGGVAKELHDRVKPRRRITGMSAVLLPTTAGGTIDWVGFEAHLERTVDAGLVPAVNMDTGFGPTLSSADRARVLAAAANRAAGGFVAGAHVPDVLDARFDADQYAREIEMIVASGGLPIVFPSYGIAGLTDDEIVAAHATLARGVDRFLGFELGAMFHPAGRIFSIEVFTALLEIPQLIGLKHSSLDRGLEWERLLIRDSCRPEFLMLSGNDLAIDMVIYGSDYLLGLSTFAPDAFAARDASWFAGDEERFWRLNDVLSFLGQLAFRPPVPGYRHNAAMFLAMRGQIECDATFVGSPARPDSDRELLREIVGRLSDLL